MAKNKQKDASVIYRDSRRNIIKKHKPILGIDIGSSTIKLVQMTKDRNLSKWALETVPTGMINQGRIEAIDPLAEIMIKILKKYKITTKECALYISGSELIVRELILPEMNEEQILENIQQEIISVLPMEHDDYCIDYKVLEYTKADNEEIGKMRVLVGAVPKELVNDYVIALKKAGLKVVYVDVLPNIAGKLCKRMSSGGLISAPRNICMVDFGAKKTEMIILRDGNYYLHKTVSYGAEYLTSLISMKSEMDLIEAEEFKCRTNFFTGKENDPVNKQVYDYFDFLIRDFERTMEFYSNRCHDKVDRVYIMGGGAMLEGLAGFMEKQLSVEVRLISEIFNEYQTVGAIGRYISVFSHSIGATFREEWKYEG